MLEIETIPCREENHGSRRTEPVSYLVVHYTAGNGDTARDNGRYFARCAVGASAHYFVDKTRVVASVAEENVAWHCGAASYRHPHCRNGNSIGVELCSVLRDGQYAFEARQWKTPWRFWRSSCAGMRSPWSGCCGTTTSRGRSVPRPLWPTRRRGSNF